MSMWTKKRDVKGWIWKVLRTKIGPFIWEVAKDTAEKTIKMRVEEEVRRLDK